MTTAPSRRPLRGALPPLVPGCLRPMAWAADDGRGPDGAIRRIGTTRRGTWPDASPRAPAMVLSALVAMSPRVAAAPIWHTTGCIVTPMAVPVIAARPQARANFPRFRVDGDFVTVPAAAVVCSPACLRHVRRSARLRDTFPR